ncbi:beta-ketoacyl synthase N-terminal-like domain-containing protein [Amycolatopsis sp.]|uniref:beta-ketoacyl synthase N-terminal-like domain-containing protein n=1 Tax=Amycolatopsis sp. TaxID=37632 RepID=UPI0039C883AD
MAITGVGVGAPGGIGVKDVWSPLTDGRTAARAITLFDASPFRSRIAAEIDCDPGVHGLRPRKSGEPTAPRNWRLWRLEKR